VLRIIDGLPVLYLVGIITIAASKNHQRVGDMAAATTVSYASKDGAISDVPSSNDGEISPP
jgi:uncharacterized RDD family membrane protein YckC